MTDPHLFWTYIVAMCACWACIFTLPARHTLAMALLAGALVFLLIGAMRLLLA